MGEFTKLLEPAQLGRLKLKNRAIMMPMATEMAGEDGSVSSMQIRYYERRAKGGVAMIIQEYTGVDDVDSIPTAHNLRIAQDYQIQGLKQLVSAVHAHDCLIAAQIHHGGATSNPERTGRQNLSPSGIPIDEGRPVPREMTKEDIRRIQRKFIDAAKRCKEAGYDAVELHGAHGYLIAQFLSKYYNRRTDEYGGSVENRCRFLGEIIDGIKEEIPDLPILVRVCGDEFTEVPGFLTLDDGIEIGKYLEAKGIDAINISAGSARNGEANCEPASYESGWKKHLGLAFKEALSIPVIQTNTIKNPEFAEYLLEEGVSDFVGLGRSQLADPDFINKAASGRSDEINECIGCMYCRRRVIAQGNSIGCAVNKALEADEEYLDIN